MVVLKVLKKFRGAEEDNKILSPGTEVKTEDVKRVNALVRNGLCEIVSFENPKDEENPDKADSKNPKDEGKKK